MKIKSLLFFLLILTSVLAASFFRSGCGYYSQCTSTNTGNVRSASSIMDGGIPFIIITSSNGVYRQYGGNMCSVTQVLSGNGFYGCSAAAGTPSYFWAAGDSGKIMFSTNRGTTWVQQTSGTLQRLNSIVMVNQQYGIAAGNNSTVLRTTNGGATWITVNQPLTDDNLTFNIYDVYYRYISPSEHQFYVVGENRTLRYSSNAGTTWFDQSFNDSRNVTLRGITGTPISNAPLTIVGDSGAVYRYDELTSHWNSQISNTIRQLNDVLFISTDSGIAAGNNAAVILTSNGGTTWYNDTLSSERITVNISSITRVDGNTVFGGGDSNYIAYGRNIPFAGIAENSEIISTKIELSQNYPNPFNPSTNIKFGFPKSGLITLKIYDVLGKEVEELVNKELRAGSYEVEWEASNFPSGIYFYELETEDFTVTKKMVLVK